MGLRPELLRGIYAYGLERPSAVQQRTIISIIQGRNVIAQAPPGTGKTATFVIPVLQRLDTSSKFNQALILTNTSELAAKIQKEVLSIGSYMHVGCYAYVDSANIREDIPRLREGVQVVVGTPARVSDMIQRHALKMADIRMFCLYDANELLSPSFKDQVMKIFQLLAKNTQIVFLSATEPTNALKVAEVSVPDALQILAKGDKLTLEGIKQFYIPVKKEGQKLVTLCKLYETITQAVVFCNSKRAAGLLTAAMNERKLAVLVIHGKVEREQCAVLMKEFLSGPSRILVTTDRYARIIDEQQVSVVINYDLPYPKKYIQRVGFGGRPGNNRIAVNLATDKDLDKLREIER
ncbi:hypothetical protein M378DRAFT_188268 [Amanita muscaria Koide BX008]|uniref:RNA helicase n=1 Tax=Amanita muscaria (strain Koide BX008) TaxID=946122 RepID=A0A0C2WQ03_AMAMK|nr:hypothetical protein M378DRAFT_188268 [Amanita muscaria Koide BX008]